MTELKTTKEYEWFLIDVSRQKLNGYHKLYLEWTCVEANYKVTERMAISEDGTPGSRLVELMARIDPTVDRKNPPKGTDFFVKGKVHFLSKVQQHWIDTRGSDDKMMFEFVYESVKPLVTKPQTVITEAMRTKTTFIARKAKNLTHAKELIARDAPELSIVLDELVKTGEVVFA